MENFQPTQLCTQVTSSFSNIVFAFRTFQIKIMKALEDDADYKLKTLKENDLDNKDIEEIKVRLNGQTTSRAGVNKKPL